MERTTAAARILKMARARGVLRPRDLNEEGIPRMALTRLVRTGQLERVGRGLYRLPDADVTAHHSIVEAITRVPHGIVCLLSALRFHDLTTQQPPEIWIALDVKDRKPRASVLSLRIVRFSGKALEIGVEEREVEGISVKMTSPSRTVVDCFRYRNKIGLDVALEALRDFRRLRRRQWDEIWDVAGELRALSVMRPYLEAVT